MSPVRSTARVALGGILMFAGASHLSFARKAFRAQVPKTFVQVDPPSTDQVVLASGVVEIALTAIFPGNLAQLEHHRDAFGLDTDRKRQLRLLGQPVLVALALWSTRTHR